MATRSRRTLILKDTKSKKKYIARELELLSCSVLQQKYSLSVSAKGVIEVEGTVPTICESVKDTANKLELRTSLQTITSDQVELKQFDPNFFSGSDNISCRLPGCEERRQRKFHEMMKKEDLYICPNHRSKVEDEVAKMCKDKGVKVSSKLSGDLKGYTSLIGVFESGYHALTKPSTKQFTDSKHQAILQEVFLNVRNYLVTVNALLNPNDENQGTALTAPLIIIRQILQILQDSGPAILETLTGLVGLMRQVMEHILFAFGVLFPWAYLSLIGNPGAQVGAGIGGFIGFVGYIAGPFIGTLTAAGGAVFGGLIGNGLYNIWGPQQGNVQSVHGILHRYQSFAQAHRAMHAVVGTAIVGYGIYHVSGNATGSLDLGFYQVEN